MTATTLSPAAVSSEHAAMEDSAARVAREYEADVKAALDELDRYSPEVAHKARLSFGYLMKRVRV